MRSWMTAGLSVIALTFLSGTACGGGSEANQDFGIARDLMIPM